MSEFESTVPQRGLTPEVTMALKPFITPGASKSSIKVITYFKAIRTSAKPNS